MVKNIWQKINNLIVFSINYLSSLFRNNLSFKYFALCHWITNISYINNNANIYRELEEVHRVW